jgi:N-ATPase, AtpR subunit
LLVGLEMDAKRMTLPVFEASPVVLAAQFAAGAGVAVLFFRGLWWHTRLIVEGGRVSTLGALTLGRFALMGGLLTSAAFEGAGPLLASAFGVFIGRFFVLRSIGRGEP